MNPCITTWPAIVPTDDEANPEASRATPKIVAALPDTVCWSPWNAPSMLSIAAQSALVEQGRRHDHHREVDHAGERHRDHDVDLLEPQDPPALAVVSAHDRGAG